MRTRMRRTIAALTLEKARGAEPHILTATLRGRPAMLLPLSRKDGPFPELSWIGGSHVNFNTGLYSRELLRHAGAEEMREALRFLKASSGSNTVLCLCNQIGGWNGYSNPMISLPHQRAANPAFFMDLSGGFDAMLEAGNAKRKRKKFRQQCRTAEAMGGYRLISGDAPETAQELLGKFLAQKASRLKALGLTDVFAAPGARDMLKRLADHSSNTGEPLLKLYGLEVGGKVRAVFGCGLRDGHLSGYFSSISDDDFTAYSPGEMLLYLAIEKACRDGVRSMDLGGGDERYKRSWCESRVELFDVIVALGPAAWPLAAARRTNAALKAALRENENAWGAIKTLRRWRGGRTPQETAGY